MKQKSLPLVLLACTLMLAGCGKKMPVTIIPQPVEYVAKNGCFTIDRETYLCFDELALQSPGLTSLINDTYRGFFGTKPNMGDMTVRRRNCILFSVNDKRDERLGDEGYGIVVKKGRVTATANTTAGLYYAFCTLLQMTAPDLLADNETYRIPCCRITDYPRFAYRGTHLDVSRHFFTVDFVKKYINMISSYKINRLHWHLTDDHGWRIRIDKYPKLTEIGAWRPQRDEWSTSNPPRPDEPMTYGGFYTKEQVRDIVDYAAARNVEIIPEIELPGHCSAVLASYPQLACDDYPYMVAVGPYWPPKAIVCAGNDDVLRFYKDVLKEVSDLFPGRYVHIGGDEAMSDNWQNCPKCQLRIAEKGLDGEFGLQQWMMNEMESYLKQLGKKTIVWDDVVSDDMTSKCTIMCWQDTSVGKTALIHGNDVIFCPADYCYFNFYQDTPDKEPLAMSGLVNLEKAYRFDPETKGLTEAQTKHILGGQCNLWTEYINTPEQAEYQLFPRLCALSECVWSPREKKDWNDFSRRVQYHQKLLKKKGINCRQ